MGKVLFALLSAALITKSCSVGFGGGSNGTSGELSSPDESENPWLDGASGVCSSRGSTVESGVL
ncbi:MAG TPA: hypothetical protein VJA16_08155 [Thermoanaerobaculia bacterium]